MISIAFVVDFETTKYELSYTISKIENNLKKFQNGGLKRKKDQNNI